MKSSLVLVLLLFSIQFSGLCQQARSEVWKRDYPDYFNPSFITGFTTLIVEYKSDEGFSMMIQKKDNNFKRFDSITFYGEDYEILKKIVNKYSEWKKSAAESNIKLNKTIYQTSTNFKSGLDRTFTLRLASSPDFPKVVSETLEVVYSEGELQFIVNYQYDRDIKDNLYSSMLAKQRFSLSEHEMVEIVKHVLNTTKMSEIENKLKNIAQKWDSFEAVD